MTDRPIIFSAPMVRALLDGRKSQTRRVLRRNPNGTYPIYDKGRNVGWSSEPWPPGPSLNCHTTYAPGDRLYVREAFSYETLDVERNGFLPPWYWADGSPASGDFTRPKPSIHMPRWASRITLTVTEVRVQRLQEISEADAKAEGVLQHRYGTARNPSWTDRKTSFEWLWENLHGPGAWDANPWVVAVSFTTRKGNIDTPSAESVGAAKGETP